MEHATGVARMQTRLLWLHYSKKRLHADIKDFVSAAASSTQSFRLRTSILFEHTPAFVFMVPTSLCPRRG